MSYTTLYEIYRTKTNVICELINSQGTAPPIWEYMVMKSTGLPWGGTAFQIDWDDVWMSPALDRHDRAVILSTYDNAYVETSNLKEFATACSIVHDRALALTDWEWCNFKRIGLAASDLADNHDHRCLGLAIGVTSVGDPWEDFKKGDIEKKWGVYRAIDQCKSK